MQYIPRKRGTHKVQTEQDIKLELYHNSVENHQGCWLWAGCIHHNGYGVKGWKQKQHRVHILSYKLFKGDIAEGLIIRHLCGNRTCCNPLHLEAGTHSENAIDAVKHKSHECHMTEGEVYELRSKFMTGNYSLEQLANELGMSDGNIYNIISGASYSYYTKVPPFIWQESDLFVFRGRLTNKGIEKAIEMYKTGLYKQTEIADILGANKSTVRHYWKKYKNDIQKE